MTAPAVPVLNGRGVWYSFNRQFNTPIQAALELSDNAIDAAGPDGKIEIVADPNGEEGVVLRNTVSGAIPEMTHILMLHNSKKQHTDDVGEFGVGINQATAALANLAFVLTKNKINNDVYRLELGIVMKDLQTDLQYVVPSCSFQSTDNIRKVLSAQARKSPANFGLPFSKYANNNQPPAVGAAKLADHFNSLLLDPDWKGSPNVFSVILSDLRHSTTDDSSYRENAETDKEEEEEEEEVAPTSTSRSDQLLQRLMEELPKRYLHVSRIRFSVGGQLVDFNYWMYRMVELSQFDLYVDPEDSDIYQKSETWLEDGPKKKKIRLFLGFDPIRLEETGGSGECALHLHSRSSGRLIKSDDDARKYLTLVSSGTDCCQGLTVIIDDFQGALPLSPTKQDVSFASLSHGDHFEENFRKWIGGIANFFWKFHLEKSTSRSKVKKFSDKVKGFAGKCRELQDARSTNTPNFSDDNFTVFKNVIFFENKKLKYAQLQPYPNQGDVIHIQRRDGTKLTFNYASADAVPPKPKTAKRPAVPVNDSGESHRRGRPPKRLCQIITRDDTQEESPVNTTQRSRKTSRDARHQKQSPGAATARSSNVAESSLNADVKSSKEYKDLKKRFDEVEQEKKRAKEKLGRKIEKLKDANEELQDTVHNLKEENSDQADEILEKNKRLKHVEKKRQKLNARFMGLVSTGHMPKSKETVCKAEEGTQVSPSGSSVLTASPEYIRLKNALEDAKSRNEALLEKQNTLTRKLGREQQKNSNLDAELGQERYERKNLERNSRAADNRIESLRSALQYKDKRIRELESRVSELQSENDEYKDYKRRFEELQEAQARPGVKSEEDTQYERSAGHHSNEEPKITVDKDGKEVIVLD